MMRSGRAGSEAWGWHRLFRGGTIAGYSEEQLLERFLTLRDEVAFEALISRHGPMVMSVCRRMLADPSDVDDAFQATFLVFVRRAATIRDRERLGSWLYGVAHRVAARARQEAARRQSRETTGIETLADRARPSTPPDELALLHEEVRRLPEKYRAVVVLCDLESQSHEDAARQLNWPVGSVKGRLFRARNLLRDRLVRRGVSLSAGTIGAALGGDVRASVVSSALLEATVQSGIGFAAGQTVAAGLISATSVALYQGVHHAMFLSKLKIAGALMATGIVVAGSGAWAHQKGGAAGEGSNIAENLRAEALPSSETPASAKTGEAKVEVISQAPRDTARVSLEQAYLDHKEAARSLYETTLPSYEEGQITIDRVIDASRQWAEAEQYAEASHQKKLESMQAHADRMMSLWKREKARLDAGTGSLPNVGAAAFALSEANLRVAQLQHSPPKAPAAEPKMRDVPAQLQEPFPRRKFVDIITQVQEAPTQKLPPTSADTPPNTAAADAVPEGDVFGTRSVPSELAEELAMARREYDRQSDNYKNGTAFASRVIDASERLKEAEKTLQDWLVQNGRYPNGRYPALDIARMKGLAEREKEKAADGAGGSQMILDKVNKELHASRPLPKPAPPPSTPAKPDHPTFMEEYYRALQEGVDAPASTKNAVDEARRKYDTQLALYKEGKTTVDKLLDSSDRLAAAETALEDWLFKHPQSRIHHVDRLRRMIESEKARQASGVVKAEDVEKVESAIATAEKAAKPSSRGQGAETVLGGMGGEHPAAVNPIPIEQDRSLEKEDAADKSKNEMIRRTLSQPMPMPFGQETPLGDVLKYIRTSTTSEVFPTGIPIYVDPAGLEQAEKTMDDPMTLDLDGVPLKTTLRLMLRQLKLGYYIRDGLLIITALDSPEYRQQEQERLNVPFPDTITSPGAKPLPKAENPPSPRRD